MNSKKNILLKLSGASLKAQDDIICNKKINKLALDIIQASETYNIGIVIGGGNIWRGNIASKIGMDKCNADDMGMLATVINSLALKAAINSYGKDVEVYSALSIPRLVKEHNSYNFKKDLAMGKIVIFAGGTGMPFFSTDTGASLTASEIDAEYILMGKNNIDGLYDKDPNKYPDAQFIPSITFEEVINKKLAVADLTCMTMCMENNIEILIFDIEKQNSILNTLNKTGLFSRVYNSNVKKPEEIELSPINQSFVPKQTNPIKRETFVANNNHEQEQELFTSKLFDEIILNNNEHKPEQLFDYKTLNEETNKKDEPENEYLNYKTIDSIQKVTIDEEILTKNEDVSNELKKMIERNKEWLSKHNNNK